MKTTAIITAGGSGKRMGGSKQFLALLGKPMLEWTIDAFKKCDAINEIILVVASENVEKAKSYGFKVAEGGAERTDSVRNGLALVSPDTDIVLIHDGARPLVTDKIIRSAIEGTKETGACIVGVQVKDTVKKVDSREWIVEETLDRDTLWQVQTPQAFRYDIIKKAYDNAKGNATDDSKLVEDLGIKVKMVMGSYENIKVTTSEDLIIAEEILRKRKLVS
ncbi:2-C-methyl-D-erythritol 4-phosphate cytidylyltransferase [candidate division WOR-1 bacterium RIFOXYC2_FULL_37_10]|uniref:2-C-methyl-D-erythritol 4-phosphate cytidylyltransferase n=1 Tax=candidate division WOR-1 bacterium RIFOXYB2_FULL_37_13 TaxID=1802579 RepID=A0A1F4SV08_UNCSA|nr:MAG: 2-C-methyl-D-erythritol 4-phosphate cytidylyltransferase [candidate division WOR-1 bacterium RIFOXYA2_FULL_37_7]OGC24197.1 MAG: 2-C-methyl-D-erythritol 4-phosphate cytidylyltransferase [candidate division WOR-1 bacterium RIFOXYB2_FULL_37_13]OGC36576.1 MAG: 2-C-methyl-D-erythritol 4-phosphate cytidylyltransferase [candidate division WOR-1 bacterium RIFOXYC2_FULL_37_10]